MPSSRARVRILLGGIAALQLAATPCLAQTGTNDPLEPVNRKFFLITAVLERVVAPIAHAYGKLPHPIRQALGNFSRNLSEPVVFANDVLQGHPGQAATTAGRFAINSIFGVAGLADVAKASGIPHHDNSFGTTLGRWGVKSGPYLFLPLIGPSTLRDAVGSAVDIGLNPLAYARFHGRTELGISTSVIHELNTQLDAEQQLSSIVETSTDPYATIRSYYLQNRQTEITGKPIDIGPLPDFDDPGAPSTTTPTPPSPGDTAAPSTATPATPTPDSVPPAGTAPNPPGDAAPAAPPAEPAAPQSPAEPPAPAPTPAQ